MAKTDLAIDITGKLKKSYSLKGKTNIIITGELDANIIGMTASGSTLTVNLEGGKTLKFTNISDPHQINITADENVQTLQEFYGYPDEINWTPKKGTTVTATVFDDFIDLSETTYEPTSKKAIKNNTGLTINGGKGDDTIIGTKYNDVVSGGAGNNTVVYNTVDTDEFGNDTIKLTKGENLVIDLTSMGLDEAGFRALLTHDSKNLFISLSDEEKVKLNNFYKSNGVGANGSVKVVLQTADPDEGIEEIVVDLNEDVILSLTAGDANKKGAITGSRLGDYITGGETVKTISAGAGNDHIVGGAGTQTLTGGAGADVFEFTIGDGVDTISDATKDDVIVVNGVDGIMDMSFKKVGNNLEIFYENNAVEPTDDNPFGLDENNKIIVKNYLKTKEANRIDTVMIDGDEYSISDMYYATQGSGTIKGTKDRDILLGGAKNDTIYGYDADDDLYGGSGNDKLIGGKGDDMLWGGSGKNTFFFTAGDGEDYVWDADKDDVIQIDSDVTVTGEKDGDDLIVKYADDSITVSDYFKTAEADRVDTLKVKHGKKYETISIKDILPVEPVVDKILIVNDGDKVTLSADTNYDTLKFVSISDPKYVNCSINDVGTGKGDNLIMQCGTAEITLTDYMKGGHSVKFFQTGPYTASYDIPYHVGTDGNDTFNVQNLDESFFTKGGNDTISFTGKDFTAFNWIYSDGTSENTTTLTFDNYALEDDNMRLTYFENTGGYNRLDIYFSKAESDGNHYGQLGYEYYFDDNKPTAIIQDSKGAVYNLNKYTTATTLNWSGSNSGNVAFLLGTSGTDTVTTNNKTNYVFSEKGANLIYTYGGGKDKVYSESYVTNDTYNIGSLNKNTHLIIDDNGGSDAINLNNTAGDNIRLFFDVRVTATFDETTQSWEYHPYAVPSSALVYSGSDGVFNTTTFTNYLSNPTKWIDGVIATDFSRYDSATESYSERATITTSDGTIDLNTYKTAVAQSVCEWFVEHKAQFSGSDSISEAIASGQISGTLLNELLALYDVKYSDVPQGGGDDDEYVDFVPDYSDPSPNPSATNTLTINPTSYLYKYVSGDDLVFKWWDDEDERFVKATVENYFNKETPSAIKYIDVTGVTDGPVLLAGYAHVQVGTDANESFLGAEPSDPDEAKYGIDDIIFGGAGNDKIDAGAGSADFVNAGTGNNKIVLSDIHTEEVYVLNGGGVDTLVFPETAYIEVYSGIMEDDLTDAYAMHISYQGTVPLDEPDDDGNTERYYDGTVHLICGSDYETSVKYLQIGDNDPVALSDYLPMTWDGTDGNDREYTNSDDPTKKISVSRLGNDTFYFGKGSDTLTLTGKFGDDTFFSDAEYDSLGNLTNTDTLVFTDLSLADHELDFKTYSYSLEDPEEPGTYFSVPSLRIYTPSTDKERGSDTTFVGYFDTDTDGKFTTPVLKIQDSKGDSYYIDRYKTAETINWNSDDEKNSNHVAFLDAADGTTTSITSNSKVNVINVVNGNLSYSYQGGDDEIYSTNETSATYNINGFDANTKLTISDDNNYEDDMDVLNLGTASSNVRLVMDVQKDDNSDIWYGPQLVHTDNFNVDNVKSIVMRTDDVNGISLNVHQAKMEYSEEYHQKVVVGSRCGLETVTMTNFSNVDMDVWKDEIVSNVQGWLTNHAGYNSAYDAFDNCTDATALAELVQCYNVDYSSLN